ncbi:MAG TPA: N-acetylmuramoyl-L-alanine amidase [Candidatus Nanoarchaeia archaeon]|nr:N-acetylmuramoyl-L-alanine amidase [Candidatus Nanoarchaeia archaeon]
MKTKAVLFVLLLMGSLFAGIVLAVCDSSRCSEIDEAWIRFSQRAGFSHAGQVLDADTGWSVPAALLPPSEAAITPVTPAEPIDFFSPPSPFSSSEWENYQRDVGATASAPGKEGGEIFAVFNAKTVTVDKPDYNQQQPSGTWTLSIDPSKSCPPDICLNDITPKQRRIDDKTGVVIHATVGGSYLGTTERWSEAYWDSAEYMACHWESVVKWNKKYAADCGPWSNTPADASGGEDPLSDNVEADMAACAQMHGMRENNGYRLSINSCRGIGERVHYIFGRNGDYAQHASEWAAIGHTKTGSEDSQIPAQHWDVNTIGIEVANAVDHCTAICNTARGTTYKGKTIADGFCSLSSCQMPLNLWQAEANYRPQSDLRDPRSRDLTPSESHEVYPEEQVKGLVKFVAEIMIRHNIHLDDLIRHYDNTKRGSGTTHTDPDVMFDWMGFKQAVCQALNQYYDESRYECTNIQRACRDCGDI